jgi:outer membrane lipoprotein-sorting protein
MISGLSSALARTLVLVVCWAGCAGAIAPSAAGWQVEELMQSLAQVRSSNARFVERKFLRILSDPLESRGTLSYTAPSHLERLTLTPKAESLILDGDRLTLEDKTRNQRRTLSLQEFPIVWAFVESIRSTLSGDLQKLRRFYDVKLEGDRHDWRLILTPHDSKVRNIVREIRISGREHALRVIEVFETGGDRSEMTIIEDRR